MQLYFNGDIAGLEKGIDILSEQYGFKRSDYGMTVHVNKIEDNLLQVIKTGSEAVISYRDKAHFFRALGLMLEAMEAQNDFNINETPQFDMNGVMIDVSQSNAVINISNLKNIIYKMAVMGLNMLMLYVEDSYEIEGEPYFGYMRGRYSYADFKECDDFADMLGIEIIPCIQTLAHLTDALKWKCYDDVKEDDSTLLVGEEKTYRLIEKMITAASAPFRSRRIHIGMDEAMKLGQGNYLLKNGYRDKFDIMTEHMERVLEIVSRAGLKPMMWSDMFFRAASGSKNDYYDASSEIPAEVIARCPKDIRLVYWDYYHHEEEFYNDYIKKHEAFGSKPVFAGGIWSWKGFGVNYGKTFATTNSALNACKKQGVREVFATVWGDGGTESNIYANMLGFQLFAEHGYSKELDVEKLKSRFRFCTGGNYDDFMGITAIDMPGVNDPNCESDFNPCKCLLWQDVLGGLFDRNIEGMDIGRHFEEMSRRMDECVQRNGEMGFVFNFLSKLCSVLSIKSEIGLKITAAYKSKDMQALRRLAEEELPQLEKEMKALMDMHRDIWFRIYKPFGWEVMGIRYGGVLSSISTAVYRLKDFVDGKLDRIEELEEERLYFDGTPGMVSCNIYYRMATASRISFTFGL